MSVNDSSNPEAPGAEPWMPEEYEPGLVSVIIPTYNRAAFLREALESVLAQTYRPLECIVVDDGSTDETEAVVRAHMKHNGADFQIRYERQANSGACAARNKGMKLSRGEFINLLDSDDLLLPDSLECKVNSLSPREVDFAYGISEVRDSSGKLLRQIAEEWSSEHGARITAYLFDTNSVLIRRAACIRTGPWDETLNGAQEVDFFSRLKARGHAGTFINQTADVYRFHSDPSICQTGSLAHTSSWLIVCDRLFELIHTVPCDREAEMHELSKCYLKVAFAFYNNNDVSRSLYCMQRAYALKNRDWRLVLFLPLARCFPARAVLAIRYAKYYMCRYLRMRLSKTPTLPRAI